MFCFFLFFLIHDYFCGHLFTSPDDNKIIKWGKNKTIIPHNEGQADFIT